MALLCSQLISESCYLSGTVAQDFETVSGSDQTSALFLLNQLLDREAADSRLIPYFRRYALTLVANQEEYFIADLLQIETFTFNLSTNIRYPSQNLSRIKYFGNGRVNNISSLPVSWHSEREKGGTRLFLYFLPQDNYTADITGKFGLTNVSLMTDMETYYDGFYIEYLRYKLAQYICHKKQVVFPADRMQELKTIIKELTYVSPPDLMMQKMNFINNRLDPNWAFYNLGYGWVGGYG